MTDQPPIHERTTARRALGLVVSMARLHPKLFAAAVTGASIFAVATVAASFAIRWIIDRVVLPRFEEGEVATGTVVAGAALVVGIGVVRAAAVVMRRCFATMTQWRVGQTLTERVVDRLVRQPVPWHRRRTDGDLVARAGVDVEAAVSVLAPIPFATGTVVLVVIASAWLLFTDVVIGGVALIVIPLLVGINLVYQRRVERHFDQAQQHLGAFSAGVHESFEGVQLVKAYGAERRETERLAAMAADVRDARIRAVRLRSTFEALLELLPALTNVTLVVVGAVRVRSGDVTIGEFSGAIFMFGLLVFPLRLIGWTLSELPRSMAGWKRVSDVADADVEPDPAAAVGATRAGVGVRVHDVTYHHPGETVAALSDVTFDVRSGTTLAVVGPTGSGKTTLIEVLGGLLPPDRGDVEVSPGPRAVVFQEAFLFAGTVRENLDVGVAYTDEELWTALELAAAREFVADLPDGLDTVVGERGVSLSGGQRQRVALARALVRRPVLLLLDDTTSALDPATEAAVLGGLRAALADTTVVMVASRPSTIALADRVAFVEGGRLVAIGTHAELVRSHPGYQALVAAFESDRRTGDPRRSTDAPSGGAS